MRFNAFLILLLAVLAVQSVTAQEAEVNHDKIVEDAIADAENEDIAPPADESDPPPPPPAENENGDEENVAEEDPIGDGDGEGEEEEDALTPYEGETDPPPTSDEILNLPHLSHPKYDEDGDVLFFPRIIGGSRAQLGEFPSKVSLQTRTGSHFCGGNLITYNHVISAGHCVVSENGQVHNPASIEIMAGDVSIIRRNAGPNRTFRIASHIFVHPGYSAYTMENDIAVLRVSISFRSVDGIIVPEPLALNVPVTGTICHLAGWGATSEGSQDASPNLMRVNLEIVDTGRCNSSYQGMIGTNMFCAGTMKGGRDACQGDSGGGLMCNGVITGIVSFGYGCARPRFPGVYTDVSAYSEFIESAIAFDGAHEDIPTPDPRVPDSALMFRANVPLVVVVAAVVWFVRLRVL